MVNRKSTKRSNSNTWEHPCELPEEEMRSFAFDNGSEKEEPIEDLLRANNTLAEEDPLFQDEDEASSLSVADLEESDQKPRKTWVTLLRVTVAVVMLILVAILTFWIVDLYQSKRRVEANPLKYIKMEEVSVDVSKPRPVVTLEITVADAAFPKYSLLEPTGMECILEDFDLPVSATVVNVDSSDANAAFGSVKYTVEFAIVDDPEKIQDWADFSWDILTNERRFIGLWQCDIVFHVMIGKVIPWKKTENKDGRLYLGDTTKAFGAKDDEPTVENDDHTTNVEDPNPSHYSNDDTTVSPAHYTTRPPDITRDNVNSPLQPTNTSDLLSLNIPWGNGNNNGQKQDAYRKDDDGILVIRSLAVERVELGLRIPTLPKRVLQVVSRIHVKLPPVQIEVATHGVYRQMVHLEEFNITLDEHQEDQYVILQVTCANDGSTTCPWYNPLLGMLSGPLAPRSELDETVVTISVDAKQSFLESMLGKDHHIIFYKNRLPEHDARIFLKRPRGNRRLQGEPEAMVDCVFARDAIYGDVLRLSVCMDIRASKGLYINADAQFYSFSGIAWADVLWKRLDDVFSLDTSAVVEIDTDNTNHANERPRLNISGVASLDLDQRSVDLQVNNTADWWPFLAVLQGDLDWNDEQEWVLLVLRNATLEVKDKNYAQATGLGRLDLAGETLTLSLVDPRLEFALDGAFLSDEDKVTSTWKLVFEDEDIMTGESSLVVVETGTSSETELIVEARSDGRLQMEVNGNLVSTDYGDELKVQLDEAQFSWDGQALANVVASFTADNSEVSIKMTESVQDHDFDLYIRQEGDGDSEDPLDVDVGMSLRVYGKDILTSEFHMALFTRTPDYWDEKGSLNATLGGRIDDQVPYSIALNTSWDFYTIVADILVNDFSLDIDGDDILSLSGHFRVDDEDNIYFGEILTASGATSEIKLDSYANFTLDNIYDFETLLCTLQDFRLGISGTGYVDAKGNMTLDVASSSMELDLHDDYNMEDQNGFDLAMSGSVSNDIVTGDIRELKVIWDDVTLIDANGQATLDLEDISVGMQAEESVSQTSIGMQRAGLNMEFNDYDELDSMGVSTEQMVVAIEGESWVKGGMDLTLNLANSTISMMMINNTTKLPIDFDVAISFDSERGVGDLATLVPFESDGISLGFRNVTQQSDPSVLTTLNETIAGVVGTGGNSSQEEESGIAVLGATTAPSSAVALTQSIYSWILIAFVALGAWV